MNRNIDGWKNALLPLGATVEQALRTLNESGIQIVLVVAEGIRLVGTLTDGDVRRALLHGSTLASKVDDIIKTNPLVVPEAISREVAVNIMLANRIKQLPVVDSSGSVVAIHLLDDSIQPARLKNLMIIMAGGKGRRLLPHTESCPKPMLQVKGRPMLEHIIERAQLDGFQNFRISTHYLGHMIEDYFGDGSSRGIHIEYLREETPLGTAGCLSMVRAPVDVPMVVTNGDVLTDLHYNDVLEYHVKHRAAATMAVRQHEVQNQYGVVKTRGIEMDGFEEKPSYRSYINAGIYVLGPGVMGLLEPNQYCDMPTLFQRIQSQQGRTIVYPMHERWVDVGRPEDLEMTR